jgi:hypothetical protein
MIRVESLEDVARIVGEKVQESAQVEFKRQLPESGKNDDLAKDLAAMANSGGGVIVYGVDESGGVATALTPFNVDGAVERVTLVASTIDEPPALQGVRRILDGDTGYLVVVVAPATRGPHLVKGQAFGRTAGGNSTLTRRQIGELFARSEGFAAEFGLAIGMPGRAIATIGREEHQRVAFEKLSIDTAYYLTLTNDGDTPVYSVGWNWEKEGDGRIIVHNDLQPIATLHPHSSARIRVSPTLGGGITGVTTNWVDPAGQAHDALWAATFG